MPRLPDKTALGDPGAYPRRPIVDPGDLRTGARLPGSIANTANLAPYSLADTTVPIPLSVANAGEGAVAQGVASLAGTVGKLAEDDLALDVIKADARLKQGLAETRREFDADPDYPTFGERFAGKASMLADESASMIRSPRLREKFLLNATNDITSSREHVLRHGQSLAREAKFDEVDGALKGYIPSYASAKDDAERSRIMRDMEDTLQLGEQSGLLTPQKARWLREHRVEGALYYDGEQRIWSDPHNLIRDLEGGHDEGRAKSPGTTSERGFEFIRRKEGFSENATWDKRQYSSGYGTKGKPGEVLTRAEAEKRMREHVAGIDDYIGANIKVPLTQAQHDALTSFAYNLGIGALDEIKDDINKGDFSTVAARMRTFNKAKDDVTGELVENRGLTARRDEEASMLEGRYPGNRYARLSPEKRHALITRAKTAQSALTQQEVQDDLESIRRTGAPQPSADGSTALDRAARVLQPNQFHKLRIAWNEAILEHKAITPLRDMSEEQAIEHLARVAPDEKAPEDSYRSAARVQKKATEEWRRIEKQRKEDPAGAVGMSPEVNTAREAINNRRRDVSIIQDENGDLQVVTKEGQPGSALSHRKAWNTIIEARLAAQERLGLPSYQRSPITRREAVKLLDMPDPSKLPENEYQKRLTAAKDRANELYGPVYGPQAFSAAVNLLIKGSPHQNMAGEMVKRIIDGQPILFRDVERLRSLEEIDRVGQAFGMEPTPAGTFGRPDRIAEYGAISRAAPDTNTGDPTLPAISFSPRSSAVGAAKRAMEAGEKANRRPTPDLVDWLKRNPDKYAIFDREYGPGAAAEILNKGKKKKDGR